jgi:RNA polymerase sigma factor (sigma-70 family)
MPIFAAERFSALLQQARGGSSDALGELLEAFRPQLHRSQAPATDGLDAAELLQDTYQAAIRSFAQFRGNTEAELFAWLRQIMHNRALNIAKRQRSRRKAAGGQAVSLNQEFADSAWHDMLIDDDETPYTSTTSREFKSLMQQAFRQLKPKYQAVITLRYGADKSFAEIAALTQQTPEAVVKTWQRALKAWRQAMEDLGLSG